MVRMMAAVQLTLESVVLVLVGLAAFAYLVRR